MEYTEKVENIQARKKERNDCTTTKLGKGFEPLIVPLKKECNAMHYNEDISIGDVGID